MHRRSGSKVANSLTLISSIAWKITTRSGDQCQAAAIVRRSWRIGANRLCARYVAIPRPSFRPRGQSAWRPRQHGSDRQCACTVPPPGRRPALAGRRPFWPLRGPWPLGPAAPGARSALVRSGSPRLRLRRSAPWPFLSFLSRLLASGLASPWAASAALPPPALCSIVGRPGPGLLAPWGAGVFRSCRFWWGRVLPRSPGFGSRPPRRQAGAFGRPGGRLRLLAQPLSLSRMWSCLILTLQVGKTGQGKAIPCFHPGSVPFQLTL